MAALKSLSTQHIDGENWGWEWESGEAVTGLLMHSLMGWKVQKLGKGLEALGIGSAALEATQGW